MSLERKAEEQMKTHELNKAVISSSNIIALEMENIKGIQQESQSDMIYVLKKFFWLLSVDLRSNTDEDPQSLI